MHFGGCWMLTCFPFYLIWICNQYFCFLNHLILFFIFPVITNCVIEKNVSPLLSECRYLSKIVRKDFFFLNIIFLRLWRLYFKVIKENVFWLKMMHKYACKCESLISCYVPQLPTVMCNSTWKFVLFFKNIWLSEHITP